MTTKTAGRTAARKSKKPSAWRTVIGNVAKFGLASIPLAVPIQINIEAAQNKGWTSAAVGIGFVLFAALCVENAFRAVRDRRLVEVPLWAALGLFFVSLNAMNAIGNLSAQSDHARDAAKAKMQVAEDLKTQRKDATDRRKELSDRRKDQAKIAGEAAPESFDAAIKAEQVANSYYWKWSDGCDPKKITLDPTKALCKAIADLEAKKSAALKRDKLDVDLAKADAELARLNEKAEAKGQAPSNADSFAEWIAAALVEFGHDANENTKLAAVRLRDGVFSVGIELMGTFAPSALLLLFFRNAPAAPRPVSASSPRAALPRSRNALASATPAPQPAADEPGDVEEWFATCARVVAGKSVRCGVAHERYTQWCEDNGKSALNLSRFGEVMRDTIIPSNPGIGKFVKHKDHFYTGFEIASPNAAAASVAASSAFHAWTPRIVGSTA
jgi:hypothetical protein